MAKFFISYRRNDSQHQDDRLQSALSRYVADPKHDIFIDVENIPYGVDFVEHLDSKVRQCEVLLALFSDRWLEADPETGLRQFNLSFYAYPRRAYRVAEKFDAMFLKRLLYPLERATS